jgi:hypothetical protein
MNFHRIAVFAFAATLGFNGVLAIDTPAPKVVVYLGGTLFDGTLAPAKANTADRRFLEMRLRRDEPSSGFERKITLSS